MTKNISEEELLLRKRARRRLLGAIALVLVAVIILPMVFDQPKQIQQQEIDVNVADAEEALAVDTISPIESLPEVESNEMIGLTEHVPNKSNKFNGEQPFVESLDIVQAENGNAVGVEGKSTVMAAEIHKSIPVPGIKPNVPSAVTDETIQVETVVVESSEKAGDVGQERFIIQLGAFSDHMKAKQQQKNLVSNGINAYTEMRKIDNKEITRVRIGPFETKLAAEQKLSELMKLGLNGVITTQ